MEWIEFLTAEERKTMHKLMERASERRKKKMETGTSEHFLFMECQCGCIKQMPGEKQDMPSGCAVDMREFLGMICNFCRTHGCCKCRKDEEHAGDEELPFP